MSMTLLTFFGLFLFSLQCISNELEETGTDNVLWPKPTNTINEGSQKEYAELVDLALEATRLSYTATHCSYRKAEDVDKTLGPSWKRRKDLEADPKNGGFHALVHFEERTGRVVLAYRGTDLGLGEGGKVTPQLPFGIQGIPANQTSTARLRKFLPMDDKSALADQCADKMLWDFVQYERLPAECRDTFSAEDLDYLAKATKFTLKALRKLNNTDLRSVLLTGHSLGAGLAVLMASVLAPMNQTGAQDKQSIVRVLAFSAPPTVELVMRRRELNPPEVLNYESMSVIWNIFDPLYVQRSFVHVETTLAICTFLPPPTSRHTQLLAVPEANGTLHDEAARREPPSCETCYAKAPPIDAKNEFCHKCFLETHIFGLYVRYLAAENPAAVRPSCGRGKKVKNIGKSAPKKADDVELDGVEEVVL